MSPIDYLKTREDAIRLQAENSNTEDAAPKIHGVSSNTPTYAVWMIDQCPYLPLATIQPNNEDSVRLVAANVLWALWTWSSTMEADPRCDPGSVTLPLVATIKEVLSLLPVRKVSGGITNTLYLVSGWPQWIQALEKYAKEEGDTAGSTTGCCATVAPPPTTTKIPDEVLVRVFGAIGMIDRDIENSTYAALAQQGIAPGYYGRFANGRLEGWCPGMRPLDVQDIPHHVVPIAQALGRMHRDFRLPSYLQSYHPLDQPSMWTQLHSWLVQATEQSQHVLNPDVVRRLVPPLSTIADELQWLKQTQIPSDAVVLFCHNDLLAANILYDDQHGTIQLIDFEYGGINYRSFDLANHFNEWAGGPPTNPHPNYEWFPTLETQRIFVKTYLQSFHQRGATVSHKSNGCTMNEEGEVDRLLVELHGFILANHLYWGLWAINQAAIEGCEEFDYMEYAIQRFRQYDLVKRQGAN